jgi:hypothetical protein
VCGDKHDQEHKVGELSLYAMVISVPSGPAIVAKMQKNIEKMSAVDMPRYNVCILCHIAVFCYSFGTKVGILGTINYI